MLDWLANGGPLLQMAWLGLALTLAVVSGLLLGSQFSGMEKRSRSVKLTGPSTTIRGIPTAGTVVVVLVGAWMLDERMDAKEEVIQLAKAEKECRTELNGIRTTQAMTSADLQEARTKVSEAHLTIGHMGQLHERDKHILDVQAKLATERRTRLQIEKELGHVHRLFSAAPTAWDVLRAESRELTAKQTHSDSRLRDLELALDELGGSQLARTMEHHWDTFVAKVKEAECADGAPIRDDDPCAINVVDRLSANRTRYNACIDNRSGQSDVLYHDQRPSDAAPSWLLMEIGAVSFCDPALQDNVSSP